MAMGNDDMSENGHDVVGQPHSHANGERLLKPPTSPMSQQQQQQQQSWRNGSRSNGTHHVDASRLNSSGATLDLGCGKDAAIYTFSPDLSTQEEALVWVGEVAQKDKQPTSGQRNGKYMRRHSWREKDQCAALVVGHYCHDQITLHGGEIVHGLGGSVSYITNVFGAVGMESQVASKVGPDFLYHSHITHPPEVIEDQRTTEFFADFTQGEERILKAGNICAPIEPLDVPDMEFELGLAVGIACEVLPETLQHMVDVARYVVVDVQALIRTIDPETGLVGLRNLEETPFYDMLEHISFLKAARNEALYVDIEKVRQKTCLIVTEGKNGSRIFSKDREFRVPAFPAIEVDPTGAGDSFLAGFSAGLYQGLPVEQAVVTGNYFGGLAVAQVGIPIFTATQLKEIEETRHRIHIEQIPFESRGAVLSH